MADVKSDGDSPNFQHDPLCDFMHYRGGKTQGCTCSFIAKVRADEREQAAQRIEEYSHGADCTCLIRPPVAAALARGEL